MHPTCSMQQHHTCAVWVRGGSASHMIVSSQQLQTEVWCPTPTIHDSPTLSTRSICLCTSRAAEYFGFCAACSILRRSPSRSRDTVPGSAEGTSAMCHRVRAPKSTQAFPTHAHNPCDQPLPRNGTSVRQWQKGEELPYKHTQNDHTHTRTCRQQNSTTAGPALYAL